MGEGRFPGGCAVESPPEGGGPAERGYMTETAKLLGVWKVDRQLAGLTGRLRTAERFLEQQQAQLDDLNRQREQAESQRKKLAA